MKYALIRRNRRLWPIRVQCRVLGVSVAGYHEHMAGRLTIARRRHLSDEALLVHYPRRVCGPSWSLWLAAHLAATAGRGRSRRQAGIPGDRSSSLGWKLRVQQLMQRHGIRARGKRRFRITTDSRHGLPIAPNLLNRNFTVAAPNRVWAGDMTYIHTEEGWLFLAVVVDLFSRRIVGWSLRRDMRSELVVDALRMAWLQRSPDRRTELIFHSDRGSQYASSDFNQVLKECSIQPSMSRKGDCWDNACSETLFASLKVERLHGQRFQTIRQAKDETLDWLLWYNRTRLHSTLKYVSPMQFEQQWQDRTEAIAS